MHQYLLLSGHLSIVTLVNDVHKPNAANPMLVTLAGMVTLTSDVLQNASSPMLVTLLGMLIHLKDVHSWKV